MGRPEEWSQYPPSHKQPGCTSEQKTSLASNKQLNTANTMSDAEVKNDVAAEAPSAEELKAQKRSAEVYFHCYSRLNTYMWPGQPCPSLTMVVVFVNL